MCRGISLTLKAEQELLREIVLRGRRANPLARWEGFPLQEIEPRGGVSAGWEVAPTLPDVWVARSKRKTAERDSLPSGDMATMGIS